MRSPAGLLVILLLASCSEYAIPEPIVIAHRGASGARPEHTLEAYRLAAEQGADFIEVDLVPTRDGHLICRHENELSQSTDIASRPIFADRRTRKRIEGRDVTGWFSEDLSRAEIRQLRAVERFPELRGSDHDGRFEIPTLPEVIALIQQLPAREGRPVGLYAEIKHPTWFAQRGISVAQQLVDALVAADFTDPGRVFIQSFDVAPLLELERRILPGAGVDLPLVQLIGGLGDPREAWNAPFDFRSGVDPALRTCLEADPGTSLGYADLLTAPGLACLQRLYAAGVGPPKDAVLLRVRAPTPVDLDRDGVASLGWQQTGEVAHWLAHARGEGLEVHAWTLRAEEPFRTLGPDATPQSLADEIRALLRIGVTGIFTDHPAAGVAARDAYIAEVQ